MKGLDTHTQECVRGLFGRHVPNANPHECDAADDDDPVQLRLLMSGRLTK